MASPSTRTSFFHPVAFMGALLALFFAWLPALFMAIGHPAWPLFIGLLIGVIIILGGLQYLPADTLGPLAEHYLLLAGKTF